MKKLNVKIWKKINERVRIVETKNGYEVQHKNLLINPWHTLNVYSTMKAALNKKHATIIIIVIRDLGYRQELIKRRTKNKI
jgi:hypothetical protein